MSMTHEDAERVLAKLDLEPTEGDALGDLLRAIEKLTKRIEDLEAK